MSELLPTDTAEFPIVIDPDPADGTLQDAIHVITNGVLKFAMNSEGKVILTGGLINVPGVSESREIAYSEVMRGANIGSDNIEQAEVLVQLQETELGAGPVLVDVFLPWVDLGSGQDAKAWFCLADGDVNLGVFGGLSASGSYSGRWRFHPEARSYSLALKCWVSPNEGSPHFASGDGGPSALSFTPASLRLSRA